jgi:peptide/nickel transport system permease protein
MVTSKQIKEKFRDYRRSFKHSWQLFKASRIGMFGLIIMLIFIFIALISPFLGLRHPSDWWAPDEDIIDIEGYFNSVDGVGTKGIFNQRFGYRLKPLGVMGFGERLYVGGGNDTDSYGVYAYDPQDGRREWHASPFETDSAVSTDIVVKNFGSIQNPDDAEIRLFFGCEDGIMYVLEDEFSTPMNPAYHTEYPPTGSYRWEYQLDGSVVEKIAVHANNSRMMGATAEFDSNDMFFASTTSGTLYAFMGPEYYYDIANATGYYLPPVEIWHFNLSNYSLTAPIVSEDGQYVYVGSKDGKLYGLLAETGAGIADWADYYEVSDSDWSSDPVCVGNPPVIYATTDDGYLHSIWGINGTARTGWENGFEIINSAGEEDGGKLTTPTVSSDGGTIMFGSSTGYFFSVASDLPASGYPNLDFDTRIGTLGTEIIVTPYYDALYSRQTYIVANNLNGTASDHSDDFTILYCLDQQANITWRKTLDGIVLATPISYNPAGLRDHLYNADVVIATVNMEPDGTTLSEGRLYSFASTGENKSPLPPTWATSDKPASGNSYLLGTDDRGHDILSQTLLGSRIALLVGFLSAAFSIGIGVVIGLVSGYYGGNVDAVLMRFTDVILVLPALPLLIVFAAMMSPSIWNIIFIIAILGWGGVARVIRSEVLSLKERPFIDSARVTGASKSRIMFKHIAPNVFPLALLYMTFAISGAILYEAALSFIGLGDPTTVTWGMMLNYVQHSNALEAWWWLLPPGICITLVCLAFFLLGRAFDEIVNPRLRRR